MPGALLWQAARRAGLAAKLFDSSTGFRLPDASVRSPAASLVRLERWQALAPYQRAVEIWPAAEAGATGEPCRIEQAEVLEGEPKFPGLRLELERSGRSALSGVPSLSL